MTGDLTWEIVEETMGCNHIESNFSQKWVPWNWSMKSKRIEDYRTTFSIWNETNRDLADQEGGKPAMCGSRSSKRACKKGKKKSMDH